MKVCEIRCQEPSIKYIDLWQRFLHENDTSKHTNTGADYPCYSSANNSLMKRVNLIGVINYPLPHSLS